MLSVIEKDVVAIAPPIPSNKVKVTLTFSIERPKLPTIQRLFDISMELLGVFNWSLNVDEVH